MPSPRIQLLAAAARLRAQADAELLGQAFRVLASGAHPDHGGSAEAMRELTDARDALLLDMSKGEAKAKPANTVVAPPRSIEIQRAADSFNTWAFTTPA